MYCVALTESVHMGLTCKMWLRYSRVPASQPAENEPCKVYPLSAYRSPRYESEPYFEYAKFVCRFKFDVGGGEYYQKALQLLLQGISVVEGLDYAKREHIEMLALLLVRIGKYNDALALFTTKKALTLS